MRMLVSLRNLLLLLPCLWLAGCGFRPLHLPPTPDASAIPVITIAPIADRSGQLLRQYLQEYLPQNGVNNGYTLNVVLEEQTSFLGIQQDSSSSYARLTIRGQYRLVNRNDTMVKQNTIRHANGYTIVPSQYASLTAEQDAREKTLRQIAQTIARQLALYFHENQAD